MFTSFVLDEFDVLNVAIWEEGCLHSIFLHKQANGLGNNNLTDNIQGQLFKLPTSTERPHTMNNRLPKGSSVASIAILLLK